MDFGTAIITIFVVGVVVLAIAAFANWYQKRQSLAAWNEASDEYYTDHDVVEELNELDIGLDDRIRKMIHPTQEVDDDPYGENSNYPSYRATLVNRGIKENQK